MSRGMSKTRRWNLAILAAVLALITAACGSSNPLGGGEVSGDLKSVVVGSADFPESKIIAEIYAQALEANGFTVGRQFGIGSRETYIPAVRDHSIDLIPEYTGNLLQYFDKNTKVTTPDDVLLALFRTLPGDLSILNPSPAEDKDTVAVSEATAKKWNLKSIADLAAHSPEVKFGAPSEFLNRTEGLPGLKAKYGLDVPPNNFVAISDGGGPATVRALVDGTVTAADIFSTSPAIKENNLVVLEDPKNNFLAANVVPLVSSQKKSDELKTVLDAVSAKLTTEDLIELNTATEGNAGIDPDEAARKWVQDNGFDKPITGMSACGRSLDHFRRCHQAVSRRHGRRRRPDPRSSRRHACRLRRAVRLRQDDIDADDQPDDRPDLGHADGQRRRRHQGGSRQAAAGHRLRHPERRADAAPTRRRQRGHRAGAQGRIAPGSPQGGARRAGAGRAGSRNSPTAIRLNCRVVSSSASASRAHWPPTRRSC